MGFRRIYRYFFLCLFLFPLTGCAIGMLLFYKDSKTVTLYRSGGKKDYFEVRANTLSHCGCTHIYATNYSGGQKQFVVFYNSRVATKTFFRDGRDDSTRLVAVGGAYTIPFDSLDVRIFKAIDSLAIARPKGMIYPVERMAAYKGFDFYH